ncbi:unnamed protein product [Aphanomyces euteiches]
MSPTSGFQPKEGQSFVWMALDVGQEETIPFTISLHEEAVASPSSKKAAGNGVEMHLIQAIQRAVLQTIKRTGGRAFEMNDILPIKELCDRLLPSDCTHVSQIDGIVMFFAICSGFGDSQAAEGR